MQGSAWLGKTRQDTQDKDDRVAYGKVELCKARQGMVAQDKEEQCSLRQGRSAQAKARQ